MIKQKPLLPPFKASIPKLLSPKNVPASQANTPSVVLPDSNQAKNPQLRASTNSDSANPESDPNDPKSSTSLYEDSFRDPRLTAFNRNVEAMRNNQVGNAAGKQTTAQSTKPKPVFLKPLDEKRLRNSLILADGGEEGAASGDVKYNPKTGKIEPRTRPESIFSVVPPEYSKEGEIINSMPDDFSFENWDSKSAKQQQQDLQKAGLSPQDQLTLLNSRTSLETLSIIADINKNRSAYGLSVQDAKEISEGLLQIANARIGAKNHDIPFLTSPSITRIFLEGLDEKEDKLIGSLVKKNKNSEIPQPADYAKKDNRIPLMKGKYIGYTTVDMTDDLYKFMRNSAYLLKSLKATAKSEAAFLTEFIHFVKTNGALDIKSQKPWLFIDGLTYKFNGEVMRNDDLGNIAFGYYGAAVYGKDFLHFGAGLYQLISDVGKLHPIQINGNFYDDPQDYDMIEYGYKLYKEDHPD